MLRNSFIYTIIPMQELDLIQQLRSTHSPRRRSAAKKLGKLAVSAAGPALLDALKRELPDKRTWETQYQMIMALGHCEYREAASLLQILAHEKFEATMVLVAVGDAYIRLRRRSDNDSVPLSEDFRCEQRRGLARWSTKSYGDASHVFRQ